MILPGESISKYRDRAPARFEPPSSPISRSEVPIAKTFPEDEPLFAAGDRSADGREASLEGEAVPAETCFSEPGAPAAAWAQRGRAAHANDSESQPAAEFLPSLPREDSSRSGEFGAQPGALEEEEIDEEEAGLAAYVEELDEDAAYDEFEEETHAVGEPARPASETELATAGENGANLIPFSPEPVSPETAELVEAEEEVDEAAEEEAELEQAQEEAEALIDAEQGVSPAPEARAEVRAPAATAAYTQRGARPAFYRDGKSVRRRGGRRLRRHVPQKLPQITDLLKEGQEILVQIAKEPIGKKGARITSHIALPGRFLVYMPTVNHTGVSRKISSEEERHRLRRIIQSERENGHGGFIVRTAAQGADEQELRADIRFLKGLWNEIRTRAENSKSPALIYHDLNVVERVLRDQVTADFAAIWVDTEQEYERILRFANRFQPALVKRVKLYTKETPLFEQFGLREEIDKALKSKVWLKSGGYIVINQTEALVAIDVNTGKYVGKTARLEDTIVKTNVDAIKEIVRQIRLRDLGGIIVIDFIDMDERRNRQKVMQALEEALRSDRSPSKVLQFNDFGLVAITRKRVKQSLERTIGSPCPYCDATGFVKNVATVCNEVYVEMRKIAKHLEHSDVMLRVHPEVAKALKANNARWLNELEELTKRSIIVKSDPTLHQEQFDIN
jgi:ribonuclease G